MLVLSLKPGEMILIGKTVGVRVSKVRGTLVGFQIRAPRTIPIVRGGLPKKQEVEDETDDEVEVTDVDCGRFHQLGLGRKKDETILIADTITITVVEIRGDKARLGIEAPREIAVLRAKTLPENDPAFDENGVLDFGS